jgi:hypothetical protein
MYNLLELEAIYKIEFKIILFLILNYENLNYIQQILENLKIKCIIINI